MTETPGGCGELGEPGEPGQSPARSTRILLAEDNPINQKLVLGMLKNRPYEIVIADNGRAALARLAEREFDLVLMDIQMPELDGLEAMRIIRRQEAGTGGHIPIVALTARAMTGDRERCLEAGADGYLAKPIHRADLLSLVAEHSGRRRPVVPETTEPELLRK